MPGAYLWLWNGGGWVKAKGDAAGQLQVDVLSTALPTGAATLAKQSDQLTKLNSILTKLAGGLPLALATGALKVREQNWPATYPLSGAQIALLQAVTVGNFPVDYPLPVAQIASLRSITDIAAGQIKLYAYGTTAWQTLLTESDAQKNLRVSLWKGGDEALISASSLSNAYGNKGLLTFAALYADDGGTLTRVGMLVAGAEGIDNALKTLGVSSMLYGFNGTTWDRLKVDANDYLRVNVTAIDATITATDSFGGNTYSKTMTMANNNPTRFETTAKLLRDVVIIVKTYDMLLGETGVVVYPVGVNETVGFTKVDISTLYFQNANADDNGVIKILGVEE